jgi:uncharacterized protein
MRRNMLVSLAAGLIFGLGLTVSQMIDPAKVIGFLDLAGDWDPSLAFVMGGAVAVAALGNLAARKRGGPLHARSSVATRETAIDRPLMLGAGLFGVGWGLIGYCPGPAVAALAFLKPGTLLFVASMLLGMVGYRIYEAARSRRARFD